MRAGESGAVAAANSRADKAEETARKLEAELAQVCVCGGDGAMATMHRLCAPPPPLLYSRMIIAT